MYATLLQVAHDIILIGGALMIILGVVLIIVLVVVAMRINNLVTKGMHTVTTISEYVMLPFTYLASIFTGSSRGKGESETHRKTTTRKK